MDTLSASTIAAFKDFIVAFNRLYDEGILVNKKDFTCQIGEWIVETIYGGKRASNGIQKGWDVEINGTFVQVKTHAKATTNSARFSVVNNSTSERIDELIIIVFTQGYKLKAFYQIPWQEALKHIYPRGKKQRPELNWSSVASYQLKIESLPRQDVIELFR